MIAKVASMSFIAFVVTALVLIASDSLAIEQVDKELSERQSPELAKRAEELFQNALILSDTQKREPARLQLQEAMRLWVQMREPGKAAKAALQVGDRYKQARMYLDALEYYNQALEVKSIPDQVKTNALYAIALVYAELYHSDLAIRFFIKALESAHRAKDLPAQILASTGLANLYYRQGDKEQAVSYIAQAQRLNKQRNAEPEPALLYLMGLVRQEEGSLENAKSALEEALAIYRKTGNVAGQIKLLCAISNLSLLSSQKQAALEQAEQAVGLAEERAKIARSHAEKVNARELRWPAWLSLARAERAAGQKERALKSYITAIYQHFEGMWWAVYIATETSAIGYREESQAAYREYVDLLMEQGKFKQAYEAAERAKARAILNRTAARQMTQPSEDGNKDAKLRELSRSIISQRLQLLSSNISPEQQAKLQEDIADAESEMQMVRLKNEIEHSRDYLVWSQPATAEQLQKKMAQDQTALVEFSLGENRSFVWLFTHGDLCFEILPARKVIEKEIKSYLDAIAAAPNPLLVERDLAKSRAQAEALFSILFGRLSEQIEPGRKLIVVPDGLLHYLPFEALIRNGRYLVEDHEISYNPSASMLGLWQASEGRVESGDQMELLAVGDPVVDQKSPSIGSKEAGNALNNKARQMFAARGFRLTPLPRARDEIQFIASLFPLHRRKVLLGMESAEKAIKSEPLRRYRRLHFATHSLIDEKSPSRSAVVLTPGDDVEEDGFLEVSEISRLNLNCDLVVVSACQTGRGQLLSGEGIVGLSRAFLYAGARSVVVSLWNVSDISTGQLMKSFYQNMTGGMSNAAALRLAKLQMLNSSKEKRHPYYWSSFVMVGKP